MQGKLAKNNVFCEHGVHLRGMNWKGSSCSLDQVVEEEPMVLLGGFILCGSNSMLRFYMELFAYGGITSSRKSRRKSFSSTW